MRFVPSDTAKRQHAQHAAVARARTVQRGLAAPLAAVAQTFPIPAVLLSAVRGTRD